MLEKDRNYFKKNQARKNKNDEAAASNIADAEAGSDLEDDADDDDDDGDNEPVPRARNVPSKLIVRNTPAAKRGATAVRKPAAIKAGSPSIQDGHIVKPRRPHRRKNWHYESAPNDSEWELKKQDKSDPYKNETIAKLRETVNRHARWCPFVQINKRLQHAHRRIRFLEGLPIPYSDESSDGEDDNPGSRNGKGSCTKIGNKSGNDPVQKEWSNGNDDNEEDAQQPDVIDDDTSTALPGKKARAKVTSANETALTTKVPTKPAQEQSPVDPNHEDSPLSDHPLPSKERDDEVEAEILSDEDSAVNHGDNGNGAADAAGGAPNRSALTGKAANSNDEASERESLTSGEELEAKGNVYLEHHRSLATVTSADATKKRKVSATELTSDAEPAGKSRKTRAN
jgi:hypothetical protein